MELAKIQIFMKNGEKKNGEIKRLERIDIYG